jgi:DNA-binding beta-propeller fold protein YncE
VRFGVLAAIAALVSGSHGLPLKPVARVPLPGAAVRFDYTSLDPTTNTLWIAHMNADELLAFDVRTRGLRHRIRAPGVHGVIAVPQLARVFASATDDRQVLTIDSRTGAVLARAPAGDYPDGLAYDPVERRVFVSDETGGVETVIDRRGRRIATVRLGGEAGNVQYDAGSHHMLVAVQTRGEVVAVDARSNRVVRRVGLPGCASPHGLLVDSARRLGFVACAANARLLTLDLATMRVVGSAGVGESPDVLAFDGALRRLYVSAESGVVAVFAEHGRSLVKLGQALLAPAAHTVAVDPRTHLVYFPLERGRGGRPELLVMKPH